MYKRNNDNNIRESGTSGLYNSKGYTASYNGETHG
jgi:hypothetical protein